MCANTVRACALRAWRSFVCPASPAPWPISRNSRRRWRTLRRGGASSPSICAAAADPSTTEQSENYNFVVELGDIVSVLTALAIGPAVFLGSSRGGVLTMLLGAAHPTAIAGVVLHDVGLVTEAGEGVVAAW